MTRPLAYRGLILDFGAVITKLPFETVPMIEDGFGLKSGSLNWWGPLDPRRDPLWRDVVEGRISEREYWPARACEISEPRGETWSAEDLFLRIIDFAGEAWLRPGMIAIINEVRARGVPVAILSNELELFLGPTWFERFSVFKSVDAIVDATRTQIFKPDPRAYRLALDAIQVSAGEALFVDDQPRNVEGAREAGLDALHFDIARVGETIAALRTRLGLPAAL
jgi:putative hydrolase of the HAD superfamily